jgi:hypothetical protein
MPRNGGNWLKLLRSRLGVEEISIDLSAALEHPDLVIRVLAAGVVWGRTGGQQPELSLPYIEAAIRSGEPETDDGLANASFRYISHKLRLAAQSERTSRPTDLSKNEDSSTS